MDSEVLGEQLEGPGGSVGGSHTDPRPPSHNLQRPCWRGRVLKLSLRVCFKPRLREVKALAQSHTVSTQPSRAGNQGGLLAKPSVQAARKAQCPGCSQSPVSRLPSDFLLELSSARRAQGRWPVGRWAAASCFCSGGRVRPYRSEIGSLGIIASGPTGQETSFPPLSDSRAL